MAFGNCVVTHNTPENLETIADAGFAYDGKTGADSLREVLRDLVSTPAVVEAYGALAQQRAQRCYTWEAVTDAYERLFYQLCQVQLPERLQGRREFYGRVH